MIEAQSRASDPTTSAWVSASAGTGKTKVLSDRVLRLFLAGVAPERILCLTFTKAAAAEMANRINQRLAEWAVMAEDLLAKELATLTGETATPERVSEARRLFARVLEAPGALKIQTMHAFCQSLLARFPLESGVAPHFETMDSRTAAETLAAAREDLLLGARAESGRIADALARVTEHVDEARFAELMGSFASARGRLKRFYDRHGDHASAALRARLGLAPGERAEDVARAAAADGAFDGPALARVALSMERGSETDRKRATDIRSWLAAGARRGERFERYARVFLTEKDEIRKTLATKAVQRDDPDAERVLGAEAARVLAAVERRKTAVVADATAALLDLGRGLLGHYERSKSLAGRLDYDDLILKARALLEDPSAAPWVLFKLDGGIDHILVDEAQDTSPEQWDVIEQLSAEFFAGLGARERERTLFAVGDAKQSIFSFQGANPRASAAARARLAGRSRSAGKPWQDVPLQQSYRSVEAVLAAVDATFAAGRARDGVASDGECIQHSLEREGEGGLVELWPAVPAADLADVAPWTPPTGVLRPRAARTRLARFIAARIRRWIEPGTSAPDAWLESAGRQIGPGDVMVLVRRRGSFVEELVRALKDLEVPVAGVDRMVLTEQLAVMDLVALGEFLLLAEDDLTLATVLKGPLVGLSEDQLFALAHDRPGSLWDQLQRRAPTDSAFGAAHAWLAERRAKADFIPPYELFAEVLNQGGRRKLLGRLGPEADDPIDEFLALALAHERTAPPSLQGFLHWLSTGEAEIARHLQRARGAVRVMTVHGAKGLQAPIVFLPDTMQVPQGDDELLWLRQDSDGRHEFPLWPPKRVHEDEWCRAARREASERREQEHRRLLYVAMTRAEDRLYVCGWHGARAPHTDCWYNLVRAGLSELPAEAVDYDFARESGDGWAGSGFRLAYPQLKAPRGAEAGQAAPPGSRASLPDWALRPPGPEPAPPRPLAPSRPAESEPAGLSPLVDGGERLRRGRAIHRLLQLLPDVAPGERPRWCRGYLAQAALGLSAEEQAEIARQALAVLDAPSLAPAFGPDSVPEVPLAGTIGSSVILGQVDRLAVTADRILVIDYKTNRAPPKGEDDVPPLYLRQMACYRSVLRAIYPGRRVVCALVWTDGPAVMTLSDRALDAHEP
ncbi:MAG: double-strand break repair helicase AddA [Alphaproteobacteria bacterium]